MKVNVLLQPKIAKIAKWKGYGIGYNSSYNRIVEIQHFWSNLFYILLN